MSKEETIQSFKSLMYNAKANWDYFSYEILFNFFSLYNNAIEENKKLKNTDLKQSKIEYLEVLNEKLQKENEELKADNYELNNRINDLLDSIPIQKV